MADQFVCACRLASRVVSVDPTTDRAVCHGCGYPLSSVRRVWKRVVVLVTDEDGNTLPGQKHTALVEWDADGHTLGDRPFSWGAIGYADELVTTQSGSLTGFFDRVYAHILRTEF